MEGGDKSGRRSRLPLFGSQRRHAETPSPQLHRKPAPPGTPKSSRSTRESPRRSTSPRSPSQSPQPAARPLLSRKSPDTRSGSFKSHSSSPGRSPSPQVKPSAAATAKRVIPSTVAARNRAQHAYEAREIEPETMDWDEVAEPTKKPAKSSGKQGLSGLLKFQNGLVRGIKSRMSSHDKSAGQQAKSPQEQTRSQKHVAKADTAVSSTSGTTAPVAQNKPSGRSLPQPSAKTPAMSTNRAVPACVAQKSRSLPATRREAPPGTSPGMVIPTAQSSPALPRAAGRPLPSPRPSPRMRRALPATPSTPWTRDCDHNDNVSVHSKQSLDNVSHSSSVNNNGVHEIYAQVHHEKGHVTSGKSVPKREMRSRLLRYNSPSGQIPGQVRGNTPSRDSPISPNNGGSVVTPRRPSYPDEDMSRNTDSDSLHSIYMESGGSVSLESPRGSMNLSGESPMGSVSRLSSDESMGSLSRVSPAPRPVYKRSHSSPSCGVRMAELRAATKRHAFSPPPIEEQEEGMLVRSPSSCSSQRLSPFQEDGVSNSGSNTPLMFTSELGTNRPHSGSIRSVNSVKSDTHSHGYHPSRDRYQGPPSPTSCRSRNPSGTSVSSTRSQDSSRSLSRGSDRSLSRDSGRSFSRDLRSTSRDSNTSLPRTGSYQSSSKSSSRSRGRSHEGDEIMMSDDEQISAYEYRVSKYMQSRQSGASQPWGSCHSGSNRDRAASAPRSPEPVYTEPVDMLRRSPSRSTGYIESDEHIYESIPDLSVIAKQETRSLDSRQAAPTKSTVKGKPSMLHRPSKPMSSTPKCDGATQTIQSTISGGQGRSKALGNRPIHSKIQRPQGPQSRVSTSAHGTNAGASTCRPSTADRLGSKGSTSNLSGKLKGGSQLRASEQLGVKPKLTGACRSVKDTAVASDKKCGPMQPRSRLDRLQGSDCMTKKAVSPSQIARSRDYSPCSSTERESSSSEAGGSMSSLVSSSSSTESLLGTRTLTQSNTELAKAELRARLGRPPGGLVARDGDRDSIKSVPCRLASQKRPAGAVDTKSLGDAESLGSRGAKSWRGKAPPRAASLVAQATTEAKSGRATAPSGIARGSGTAYAKASIASSQTKYSKKVTGLRATPMTTSCDDRALMSSKTVASECDNYIAPKLVQSQTRLAQAKSSLQTSRLAKPRAVTKATDSNPTIPKRSLPTSPSKSGPVQSAKCTKAMSKQAAISRLPTEKSQVKSKSVPKSVICKTEVGDNIEQSHQNESIPQSKNKLPNDDTLNKQCDTMSGLHDTVAERSVVSPNTSLERRCRPPVPVRSSSLPVNQKSSDANVDSSSNNCEFLKMHSRIVKSPGSPAEGPSFPGASEGGGLTATRRGPSRSLPTSPDTMNIPAPSNCQTEQSQTNRSAISPDRTVPLNIPVKSSESDRVVQKMEESESTPDNNNISKLCKPYQRSKLMAPKWNRSFLKSTQKNVDPQAEDVRRQLPVIPQQQDKQSSPVTETEIEIDIDKPDQKLFLEKPAKRDESLEMESVSPSGNIIAMDTVTVFHCSVSNNPSLGATLDGNNKFGENLDLRTDICKFSEKDIIGKYHDAPDTMTISELVKTDNDIEIETVEVMTHIEHYDRGNILKRKSSSSASSFSNEGPLSPRGRVGSFGNSCVIEVNRKMSDVSLPESPLCDSGIMSESSEDSIQTSPEVSGNVQGHDDRKSSHADSLLDHSNCSSGEDVTHKSNENCNVNPGVIDHKSYNKDKISNIKHTDVQPVISDKSRGGVVRTNKEVEQNDSDGTVTLSDDENISKSEANLDASVFYKNDIPAVVDSASSLPALLGNESGPQMNHECDTKHRVSLNEQDLTHMCDTHIFNKTESSETIKGEEMCAEDPIDKYEEFVENINTQIQLRTQADENGVFKSGPLRSSDRSSDSREPVCLQTLQIEVGRGVLGQVKRNKRRPDRGNTNTNDSPVTSPTSDDPLDKTIPPSPNNTKDMISIFSECVNKHHAGMNRNARDDITTVSADTVGSAPSCVDQNSMDRHAQSDPGPDSQKNNQVDLDYPIPCPGTLPTSARELVRPKITTKDTMIKPSPRHIPHDVLGHSGEISELAPTVPSLTDKAGSRNVKEVRAIKGVSTSADSQASDQTAQVARVTASFSPRLNKLAPNSPLRHLQSSRLAYRAKAKQLRQERESKSTPTTGVTDKMESPILKPRFYICSNESLEGLTQPTFKGYENVCDESLEAYGYYDMDASLSTDDLSADDNDGTSLAPPERATPCRSLSSPSLLKKRYEEHKKATQEASAFISGEVHLKRAEGTSDINLKVEREDGNVQPGSSPLEKGTAASETSLMVLRSISWDAPQQVFTDGEDVVVRSSLESSESDECNQKVSQVASELHHFLERQISQSDDVTENKVCQNSDNHDACSNTYISKSDSGSRIPKACTAGNETVTKSAAQSSGNYEFKANIPPSAVTSSSSSEMTSSDGKMSSSSPRIDEGYDTLRSTEKILRS